VGYTGRRVTATPPQWDHIPPASFQELSAACVAWNAAYEATKIPHTAVQTAEKNRVRESSETLLRETLINLTIIAFP
jgi:hypothetical protein